MITAAVGVAIAGCGATAPDTNATASMTPPGLPLHAVDIATSGDVEPPYPDTSAGNRTRNQTATLVIAVDDAGREGGTG